MRRGQGKPKPITLSAEDDTMIRKAAAQEWDAAPWAMAKADYIEWMLRHARGELRCAGQ